MIFKTILFGLAHLFLPALVFLASLIVPTYANDSHKWPVALFGALCAFIVERVFLWVYQNWGKIETPPSTKLHSRDNVISILNVAVQLLPTRQFPNPRIRAFIFLHDPAMDTLCVYATSKTGVTAKDRQLRFKRIPRDTGLPLIQGAVGHVFWRERFPLFFELDRIPDLATRFHLTPEHIEATRHIRTIFAMPLTKEGRLIGVLSLDTHLSSDESGFDFNAFEERVHTIAQEITAYLPDTFQCSNSA